MKIQAAPHRTAKMVALLREHYGALFKQLVFSNFLLRHKEALQANCCTVHKFTKIRDSHEDFGTHDGALLPILDKVLQKPATKNFYLIHLMGGHSLYYERYPYAFAKFSAQDIRGNYTPAQKLVIAQYNNAMYYNDYIVTQIIHRFADKDAVVIYMPDHGESLYDRGSPLAGHVEENPNRLMLDIPLIIYASPSFKKHYPQKWHDICAAVNRPYMTDDMIDTILDLASIKTPEYQAPKSLINVNFDATRPRMNQGHNYQNIPL